MRLLTAILVFLLSGFAAFRAWDRWRSDELRLLFFDVGQGDSSLIRFPGGKTMLIDAGGGTPRWNVGSRVIFPELTRFGILHLDYAMLTHPDSDHVRGFEGLLPLLSVGEIWLNEIATKGDHYRPLLGKILRQASEKGIDTQAFSSVRSFEVAGAQLMVFPLSGEGRNDSPLVTLLTYRGCRVLFTADIEQDGERALLRDLRGPIDLLKVAHHGSKSSSTIPFLKVVRPQVSVISAGAQNRYGHPHLAALDRLSRVGTDTLRTDFHGFLEFSVDQNGVLRCVSYQGNCGSWACRHYQ